MSYASMRLEAFESRSMLAVARAEAWHPWQLVAMAPFRVKLWHLEATKANGWPRAAGGMSKWDGSKTEKPQVRSAVS